MDQYTATEQAYKNGYEAGIKEFAETVKSINGNSFLHEWYENADIVTEFNQDEFEKFINVLAKEMVGDE